MTSRIGTHKPLQLLAFISILTIAGPAAYGQADIATYQGADRTQQPFPRPERRGLLEHRRVPQTHEQQHPAPEKPSPPEEAERRECDDDRTRNALLAPPREGVRLKTYGAPVSAMTSMSSADVPASAPVQKRPPSSRTNAP